ncbi:MAG: 39S ribosomal protein L48, mitochondrial [Marteilia pararefringens]
MQPLHRTWRRSMIVTLTEIMQPPYLKSKNHLAGRGRALKVHYEAYDFGSLECFQSLTHKFATKMLKLNIMECFALQTKKTELKMYRPQSEVTDDCFILRQYARVIKIKEIDCIDLKCLTWWIQRNIPSTVSANLSFWDSNVDEATKYIPIANFDALMEEYLSLGGQESDLKQVPIAFKK